MRRAASLLSVVSIVAFCCVCLCGCSDDDVREETRPHLEQAPITVRVGETVSVRVLNATEVSPLTVPDIIDLHIDGATLKVTGIKTGERQLRISADGQQLACTVTVIKTETGGEPEEEEPAVTQSQLADASLRIITDNQGIRYGEAGMMFTVSHDLRSLKGMNLSTGLEMEVCFTAPLNVMMQDTGTASVDAGGAHEAGRDGVNADSLQPVNALSINGESVDFISSEIMCCNESATWIRLRTRFDGYIWIVVPATF